MENAWNNMKNKIQETRPNDINNLNEALKMLWCNTDPTYFSNFVESMSKKFTNKYYCKSPKHSSEDEIEDAVDPVNEYRDEETSPKTGGKASLGGSGIGSRGNSAPVKKSSKPSKMVDLGAAATFGRDGNSTQSPQTTPSKTKAQNNDLLDNLFGSQASNGTSSPSKTSPTSAEDDFDPRAGEAGGAEKPDFGDFNSAFGNATAPANGNSDFADFSNFSQTTPEPPGGSSNASLLMGISAPTPAAAPASSATSPVAPAAPAPHSSNMDLLDDLLGSATTSPSSSSVAAVPPSTPSVASSDLLGGLGGSLGGALTPTPAATSPIMPVSTMPGEWDADVVSVFLTDHCISFLSFIFLSSKSPSFVSVPLPVYSYQSYSVSAVFFLC
ncbi:mucin-2-like [Penaeus indicus]|uniref:mucin-2-like n=1 Tax=Penaeus indicus TaxID=29960 RepID=UPI00300CA6BE